MSIDDGDVSIIEEVIEVEVHCSYIKKEIVDWVNYVERVYGQSFVCPIPNARRFKPQDLRRAKHYRYDIWGYRYLVAAAFRAHPAVQRLLAYGNSDDTTYWTREDGEAYAALMRHVVVHGGKVCETPICSLNRGS
jgi:hypothetical protein